MEPEGRLPSGAATADEAIAAAETRTRGYLPRIAAALAAHRTSEETDQALLVADAEVYRGKVRDVYRPRAYPTCLVLVATGRQSAFDRHLARVPFKGDVLNRVSAWWFDKTQDITPNHVRRVVPEAAAVVAAKCEPFAVEFVVRAYATGSTSTSLWTHYAKGVRTYCGHALPEGLVKNQKLAAPLVTPTTKDAVHDTPISPEEIVATGRMTRDEWTECEQRALALFARGQTVAASRGLILVDTKYEFGTVLDEGTKRKRIVLIDEIHTPDSSRYWLAASYETRFANGEEPENIDKEFLRLWYKARCDPYKDAVIPDAPDDLVCELARRYILLYELITGEVFFHDDPSSSSDAAPLSSTARAAKIKEALEAVAATST